ncbi:MAG: endopeptidase La [Anaerolineales bacterium]|nr:endopeptidase La [Anaerolineales bacterium]MCS7246883.1 endopeptidase La [Anaerolineales bacterium]MDW8160694.1 endopeptidase La [Anaerolineales bacterium]MDW8448166.1 endopeptidase La [Anaerolineales bacterium]
MSATRWLSNMMELLGYFDTEDLLLSELVLSASSNPAESGESASSDSARQEAKREGEIPEVLPILPLRGLVVYPQTVVPLTVGQPRSIRLVDDVVTSEQRIIGLVASKNPELELPNPPDLYEYGTAAVIHRLFRAPDGTIRLVVQGISRFRTLEYVQEEPYLKARIELRPEVVEEGTEIEALARNARSQFERIAEMIPSIPRELVAAVLSLEDPLQIVYTVANFQRMDLSDAEAILELDSVSQKLHKLVAILAREIEVLEIGQKIQNEARSEIEKVQREYFLREQLKAIQRELGEADEQQQEIEEFRKRIEAAKMPEEAEKQARRELDRLSRLPTAAAEYGVIRTYLDWLVSLPWSVTTEDNLDIAHARQVLDQDHYGLEDVKERILEYLAVRRRRLERAAEESEAGVRDEIRRVREGAILCFVGPPGVGKTSLGRSIARAMGRKFVRISLGGVRDEAEIRGHRRTYIGALPGRIIQALRRVESRNPVFMLDEVDKLVFDFHGDPASALLEVLDPEQNSEFRDHYLEVPFDLSQVLFITTANTLETIPGPLRDRMEIIQISGYTDREKIAIARHYLIPRQIRENGLRPEEISFTDEALEKIIRSYTREAGVRNLEREIGAVCRKVVTRISEGKETSVLVTPERIREFLGREKYFGTEEIAERTAIPGVATGLAWTPVGGDILFVEATSMPGSKGFQLTGSLGNVMQESARAALSYVRSRAQELGIDPKTFEKIDIHLHVPSGAQPKDGPSAGVTMVTALASVLTQRPVRPDVAMTGEITLRGQVLPVGGIKEKVLAAHRSGLKVVILPSKNKHDLEDLPEEVRNSLQFIFVDTVDEVLKVALDLPIDEPKPPSSSDGKASPSKAKRTLRKRKEIQEHVAPQSGSD